MLNWVKIFFSPSKKPLTDDSIFDEIKSLKLRVKNLEKQNSEIISAFQDFSNKIDNIHPVIYNIHES
jgi:hypothetical protein